MTWMFLIEKTSTFIFIICLSPFPTGGGVKYFWLDSSFTVSWHPSSSLLSWQCGSPSQWKSRSTQRPSFQVNCCYSEHELSVRIFRLPQYMALSVTFCVCVCVWATLWVRPPPWGAKSAATGQPSCQKVFEESGSGRKFLDPSPVFSNKQTIRWKHKRNYISIFRKWTYLSSVFFYTIPKL